MTKRASWNGQILAESDDWVTLEDNIYFIDSAINKEFFKPSDHTTFCGWKGDCKYYHIDVDNKTNENACWYYPEAYDAAKEIRGRVAFWKGVVIEDV